MLVAVKGLEETGGLSIWTRVDSYLSIETPSPPPSPTVQIHAHNGGTLHPLICTEVAETHPPVFHPKCFCLR